MTLFEKLLRADRDQKEAHILNATKENIIKLLGELTPNSYALLEVDVGGAEGLKFIFRVDESELLIQNEFGREVPPEVRRSILLQVGKEAAV